MRRMCAVVARAPSVEEPTGPGAAAGARAAHRRETAADPDGGRARGPSPGASGTPPAPGGPAPFESREGWQARRDALVRTASPRFTFLAASRAAGTDSPDDAAEAAGSRAAIL